MKKADYLSLLMLLSAMESWAYSTGKPLPNEISADLKRLAEMLREEVLK